MVNKSKEITLGLIFNKQFRKGLQHIANFRIDRCNRNKRIQNFLTPKEIDRITFGIARHTMDFMSKNMDKFYYQKDGDNNIDLKGIEYEPKQDKRCKK